MHHRFDVRVCTAVTQMIRKMIRKSMHLLLNQYNSIIILRVHTRFKRFSKAQNVRNGMPLDKHRSLNIVYITAALRPLRITTISFSSSNSLLDHFTLLERDTT